MQRPSCRYLNERPSIYWFRQTLGPHSCAAQLIVANALEGSPFFLRFRGRLRQSYLDELHEVAISHDAANSYECLPLADPKTMVLEASRNEVLFGSQPTNDLFHQLAIGNKVFTGLLAGCALLLSDTTAHRSLAKHIGSVAELTDRSNVANLRSAIRRLSACPLEMLSRRERAWDLGTSRFNWELEDIPFVRRVNKKMVTQ